MVMNKPVLNRRHAIALAAGGLSTMYWAQGALAMPHDTLFNVFRKGSMIGTHAIKFNGTEDGLQVISRLDLAIKVAFITAYRYEQTGDDIWEHDVLVQTRVRTNDDGEDSLVVADARDGRLAVNGPTGNYETSLGAMTDLSFWNQGITRGQPVIDSQTGELIEIEVQAGTSEQIELQGRIVAAERFGMAATKGRSGTLWYDASGNLIKALVLTRGEILKYELAN